VDEHAGEPVTGAEGDLDVHPRTAATPRRLTPAAAALAALTLLVAFLAPAASSPAGAAGAFTTAAATVAVTPATVTPTDVGRPSWWDGDCDANRWGRIAASYGWTGQASHRMGASYLGVPVCGPRPFVDGSPNVLWGRAGWGEAEWQCVELAQRFMAQVYGTKAYQANGSQVVRNYRTTYGGGLVTIANGTKGRAPAPGDIVSFTTPNNPWGHVVVVVKVTVDASGNGSVTMLSQNDTADGWRTLPLTAWRMGSLGSLTPYGWLHDPLGRGNPLGEGSFVHPSNQKYYYRIVGGAPVLVTTWKSYGGPQPYAIIDPPQFAKLRAYPKDGTYLRDTATKQIYRMAGGAPLSVDPADAPKLPGWGTASVIDVDHLSLGRRDHLRTWPVDHTQLCRVDNGACYVTAGGAPMLVPAADAATTPGWVARRTTYVSGAEFRSAVNMRTTPVDGTFLCDAKTGRCYRTAGGSPLLMGAADPAVPGFDATRAVRAPHWEFAHATHLRGHPLDGTVLCPVGDPRCYVVAGHAPIVIASTAVPTTRAVVVARTELTHPVRLAARPVDGTVLRASQNGSLYVVRGGAASLVPPSASSALVGLPVAIDRYAIDNAGVSGPWSHLASQPAVARLAAPTVALTTARSVSLTWPVPVSSSIATTYDVRYEKAPYTGGFTGWVTPRAWQGLRTTSVRTGTAPGFTYCFQVRAHNRAGQVGPWSPTRCTATALDDRTYTTSSPDWRRGSAAVLYAGTSTRTQTHGAWWKLAGVSTDRVGLVATTCKACGSVAVWLNRTRLGVIDLSSPTTVYQRLFELPRVPLTSGVLTIIVTSPTGKTVQLDGLALSRT
jgi:hypothetical protein